MIMTTTREIHRRIKAAIAEIESENQFICTNVELIAEKAKVDVRTTKNHLELLEENNLGKFCDARKKTFSTAKNIVDRMQGCDRNE
jgi:uncharacterized protein YllA (UPF0747 family)